MIGFGFMGRLGLLEKTFYSAWKLGLIDTEFKSESVYAFCGLSSCLLKSLTTLKALVKSAVCLGSIPASSNC